MHAACEGSCSDTGDRGDPEQKGIHAHPCPVAGRHNRDDLFKAYCMARLPRRQGTPCVSPCPTYVLFPLSCEPTSAHIKGTTHDMSSFTCPSSSCLVSFVPIHPSRRGPCGATCSLKSGVGTTTTMPSVSLPISRRYT